MLHGFARVLNAAAEVERLENDNRTHKWTADELRAIKREYAEKIKRLKKLRAE